MAVPFSLGCGYLFCIAHQGASFGCDRLVLATPTIQEKQEPMSPHPSLRMNVLMRALSVGALALQLGTGVALAENDHNGRGNSDAGANGKPAKVTWLPMATD